ncbi:prolyl endopeptidase-like [Erpetoichthys calabaricus]|uniref:prolyl endopeptidase-like n=1 Tax=Erpetoichthys calabaricus TaxID=27687 RepID=UPI0022348B52|nr:prolyl endopeptidase-like [Erpetoichthys calabaricus]
MFLSAFRRTLGAGTRCLSGRRECGTLGQLVKRNLSTQDDHGSNMEDFKSQIHKYHSLETYFKKKLRKYYRRFTDTTQGAVVHGVQHLYFEEGDSIYRVNLANCHQQPEILLSLSAVESTASLQRVRLSPGEKFLAATVKSDHSEEASCVILKLGDNPAVTHIQRNVFSFEWARDEVLFYTSQSNLRSLHVYCLTFDKGYPETSLVYEEQDSRFFVELWCSKDKKFITINCNSKRNSEVHLINCFCPSRTPVLVQPRTADLIYHVDHRNEELYILANIGPNSEYQVLKTAVSSPSIENWRLIYSPGQSVKLVDMELFDQHCVILARTPQCFYLDCFPLGNVSHSSRIMLPPWACAIEAASELHLKGDVFRFKLSSPVEPPKDFLYSPVKRQLFSEEGFTKKVQTNCTIMHTDARSQDGTLVPMTVFHMGSDRQLTDRPLLVHVYGAYGMDLDMAFKPESRLLLDSGWILAYCHVRGGGELGLAWHAAGCLTKKKNGLDDLKACIVQLFKLGLSQPSLTALTASSAGGVLVGAFCNENPELIRAVVLRAPFLDVLHSMQDPSLALTIEEQEEWGDPAMNSSHRDYIASYCPFKNLRPQTYPSIFITAYEEDQRVPLQSLWSYINRLKDVVATYEEVNGKAGSSSTIILDSYPGIGHSGPTDLKKSIQESARHLAFLYRELGIST